MSRYLPTFLAILVVSAGSGAATLSLGARYKDESNGFQVYPPRKWEQVPTKFQEVALIGKWAGKAKRGVYAPEMYVLRFLHPAGAGDEEGGPGAEPSSPEKGIPGYESMLRFQPRDIWQYVQRLTARIPSIAITEDMPEFKMSSRKYRAHVKIWRQDSPPRVRAREADKQRLTLVAAEIDTVEPSGSSYGMLFLCTVADEKDMLKTFERSIRRFKILDSDDDEEDAAGASLDKNLFVDSSKKPEQWREARRRKLIPGWDTLDTTHYMLVYNKEVKRTLIRKIAKQIEAIRAQVYEKLFPPSHEVTAISVVRVCKDAAEYHRYGGPGGSAGPP